MSDFVPGLEGVIAFETEIAEPDKEGSALRYRGVDIEDLVGRVSYGNVWGLLVDNEFNPGLPPAEPFPIPVHSGDVRVDVQSAHRDARPRVGVAAAARHRPRRGSREPRPRLGHGAVLRRAVRARRRPADGAAGAHRRGPHGRRALHGPLARRPRPQARRSRRRLLRLGRRARHERLDVHLARHREHRRRRRRRDLRRGRRDERTAARRGPLARPGHDRGDRAHAATPAPTSRTSSTRATD